MTKTLLGYMNSNSLCSVPRNLAIHSLLQSCHLDKSHLPEQVSRLTFLSHLLQHVHSIRLLIQLYNYTGCFTTSILSLTSNLKMSNMLLAVPWETWTNGPSKDKYSAFVQLQPELPDERFTTKARSQTICSRRPRGTVMGRRPLRSLAKMYSLT